ncbi:hypothetical protein [Pedobacter hartonius]|uniref:Uncharacterized protein n=1 Tax=Pedobacter hartonius TaxID=425514 RepID=A0A1H4HBY6_9SPHI|nr:hypothetical protein [Pedobacter hartonius]SEB18970.1 hypothetical protein SAMN05443550_11513 [Pedobacter hartonius]
MSIQDTIVVDANNSSREVGDRAIDEMKAESIRSQRLQNDIVEQDKNERKDYANVLFTVTIIWLFLVLGIFISVGRGILVYSDSVIITLLTTTTANVVGLVIIVANYLFKK